MSSSAAVGGHDASLPKGFPRGPSYCSLLVSYSEHVALRLWKGEVKL